MTDPRDTAAARLDDYVRGHLPEAEADDYEADLFTRALDGAAPELAFRAGVGHTLRAMAARGSLDLWLTARDVERVVQSGRRVLQFDLAVTPPSELSIEGDFELLITRVPLPLEGVRRLEAEVFSLRGERLKVMPDIAFDPADGAIFTCCEAELARSAADSKTVTRVYAIDDTGRRLLCELKT